MNRTELRDLDTIKSEIIDYQNDTAFYYSADFIKFLKREMELTKYALELLAENQRLLNIVEDGEQ
jgi:hypothetical protein